MAWLFWPVSVAVMSRSGHYLLSEVVVLARIGGRYGRTGRLPWGVVALAPIGGRHEP